MLSRSVESDSCNPIDCTLPGSSVHGILQARILEWVAISFYRESFWPRDQTQVSCIAVRLFSNWAMREAHPRQEHWSGLPFSSPMHESEKWKWEVNVKSLSRVWLLATPWTAAYQAAPCMGFSRQEYWSGVPSPSLENLLKEIITEKFGIWGGKWISKLMKLKRPHIYIESEEICTKIC